MQDDSALTDAKIAAAEARTDMKITRMEGKLDLVLSKLGEVNDNYKTTRTNMLVGFFSLAGLFVALAGVIIAIWAAMPAFMDVGSKVREIAGAEARAVASQPKAEIPKKP